MHDRRDTLAEGHEETFDWTFLEGETQILTDRLVCYDQNFRDSFHTINVNFKSWLQEEHGGLFCVMGKAGSGKSTFMYDCKATLTPNGRATDCRHRKSLATKTEVEAMLQPWTVGRTLLRADHYFWILGPPKQKSIEGMLRSLLYTVLRSFSLTGHPDNIGAIRKICGTRWQSANKYGTWSCKELKDMLHRLASV
jgi:hypothetical protein